MVLHPEFDVFTPSIHALHTLTYTHKKAHLNGWASRFKEVGLLFQSHFFLVPIKGILHRILVHSQLPADSTIANYFPVFIKSAT